jgi:hypothetical protein
MAKKSRKKHQKTCRKYAGLVNNIVESLLFELDTLAGGDCTVLTYINISHRSHQLTR